MNRELLTEEDINFLINLGKKRKNQERDGCADPVFWMIYDTHHVYREDGSEIEFYVDGEEYYSTTWNFREEYLKEFKDYCIDNDLVDEDDLENFKAIKDNDDLYTFINEYHDINISIARFDVEYYISSNTGPFLTKEAAQKHIEENRHHYSKGVTTYGMVGWRNPEFEQLMNIVEKFSNLEEKEVK